MKMFDVDFIEEGVTTEERVLLTNGSKVMAKRVPKNIYLSSLSTLQAAKYFLMHERIRHIEDVEGIDKDLEKLKDIELPEDVLRVLGSKFIIPERR
jgi:hypothetical protein